MHKEHRRQFVTSIIAYLVPATITRDFPEYHATPVYERYADNEDGQVVISDDPPEELAPTPEVRDMYVNI